MVVSFGLEESPPPGLPAAGRAGASGRERLRFRLGDCRNRRAQQGREPARTLAGARGDPLAHSNHPGRRIAARTRGKAAARLIALRPRRINAQIRWTTQGRKGQAVSRPRGFEECTKTVHFRYSIENTKEFRLQL